MKFLSRISKYLFAVLMVSVLFQSVAIIVIHYSEHPGEPAGNTIAARFDNEHLGGRARDEAGDGNVVRAAGRRGADRIREENYIIRTEADRFRGDAEAPATARIRRQTERRIEDVLRGALERPTAAHDGASRSADPLAAAIRGEGRLSAPTRPAVLHAVADIDSFLRVSVANEASGASVRPSSAAAAADPADGDAWFAPRRAGTDPSPEGTGLPDLPAGIFRQSGVAAPAPPADPLKGLLASAPTATDASPVTGSSAAEYYEVKPGDSLERIARRNGTTVAALRRLNDVDDRKIRPGQRLRLPDEAPSPAAARKEEEKPREVRPVAVSSFAAREKESRKEEERESPATRGLARDRPSSRLGGVRERERDDAKKDNDLGRIVKKSKSDRRGFAWPLRGRISSPYGMRVHPVTYRWDMHTGIDIAAGTGTPIRAALGGTVTFAGWMGGYGKIVVVKHANGYETRYAHCSKLLVKRGDRVAEGSTIAKVGSTGTSTGPHVHFEVIKNGRTQNPSYLLK